MKPIVPLHKHLLVRTELAAPPKKSEINFVKEWIKELVKRLNMKIMAGPYVEYCEVPGNRGFTSVCIIETSHVAMHVWDEQWPALVQLDVYSCSELDPKIVFDMLGVFGPVKIEYKFLDREHSLTVVSKGDIGAIFGAHKEA